jgi:hypothetical protein
MKTLLTSTALVAMLATGATANTLSSTNTVDWAGNSGGGGNGTDTVECTFSENTEGTMTYNETDKKWTTTVDASVKILVRNGYGDATGLVAGGNPFAYKYALDKITVQPVNKDGTTLGGSVWEVGGSNAEYPAAVDYNDGAVVTDKPAGWTSVSVTPGTDNQTVESETLEITQTDATSGYVTVSLGGTATVALPTNTVLDANTAYKVRHLVTCMQNGTAGPWNNGVDTDTTN